MAKDLIVLENRYRSHQRVVLICFAFTSLLFVYNSINETGDLTGIFVTIFFLILTVYLICLAFSKKGLLSQNDKLYKIISIGKIILLKTNVKFSNRKIVSILVFRKRQKYAFIPSSNPDQGESLTVNEIFLLNENHTERDSVIYFEKRENSELAIDFLTSHFPLKYEEFSPDFD